MEAKKPRIKVLTGLSPPESCEKHLLQCLVVSQHPLVFLSITPTTIHIPRCSSLPGNRPASALCIRTHPASPAWAATNLSTLPVVLLRRRSGQGPHLATHSSISWASLVAQLIKNVPTMWETLVFWPGSNQGLLHCRQILYHLSLRGSPRILEWVAYPFSSGSS